jgi:restriction system protein
VGIGRAEYDGQINYRVLQPMPVPDYQSLMIHVLSAAADGEVRIGEVVERLADQLRLTAEERAELLPSGKQTLFANRVHWAKTYLSKRA